MGPSGRSLAKIIGVLLLIGSILLWVGFGAAAVGLAAIFVSEQAATQLATDPEAVALGGRGGVALLILGVMAGLLLMLELVKRLRRVLRTVEAGDPFHPANPRELRVVAILLAAITLWSWVLESVEHFMRPGGNPGGFDVDFGGLLGVLIVFVLAEVFREGARLRSEAELTV